jgi:hypothetical protein
MEVRKAPSFLKKMTNAGIPDLPLDPSGLEYHQGELPTEGTSGKTSQLPSPKAIGALIFRQHWGCFIEIYFTCCIIYPFNSMI